MTKWAWDDDSTWLTQRCQSDTEAKEMKEEVQIRKGEVEGWLWPDGALVLECDADTAEEAATKMGLQPDEWTTEP